jgi:hypothetical protein
MDCAGTRLLEQSRAVLQIDRGLGFLEAVEIGLLATFRTTFG